MMKIWIGNLKKYNEGILDGKWFDLEKISNNTGDVEDAVSEFNRLIKEEVLKGDEEYQVHDFENSFGIELGRFPNFEECFELLEIALDESEEFINAVAEHVGGDITDVIELIEENEIRFYEGVSSEYDLGYYLLKDSDLYMVPAYLESYIDYEKYGRDQTHGSYNITSYGTLVIL